MLALALLPQRFGNTMWARITGTTNHYGAAIMPTYVKLYLILLAFGAVSILYLYVRYKDLGGTF